MRNEVGKFTITVPSGHPQAGTKIDKAYDYLACSTDAEAQQTLTAKSWNLRDLVNDCLKSAARSNAYQNALAPYRPSEVSPDDIRERMIRDFIRLGVAENVARTQVEGLLAATTGSGV